MDVQKVAAQSAAGTSAQGQRNEEDGKGTLTSFVDLIRKPLMMATPDFDPFAQRSQDAAAAREAESGATRETKTASRDDAPREDSHRDDSAPVRDEAPEARENDQSASRRDDDGRPEDKPAQDKSDRSAADNQPKRDDSGSQKQADVDSGDEPAAPLESESDQSDAATKTAGDQATDASQKADNIGNAAIAPALDNLRNQTQNGIQSATREIAQALAATAQGQNTQQSGTTTQQGQNQQQNSADSAQTRNQAADQAQARIGLASSNASDATAKAASGQQQALADQQAKALSDQLKSQDPVNIRVRETIRGPQLAASNTTGQSAQGNTQTADVPEILNPVTAAKPAAQRTDGAQITETRQDTANNQALGQAQAQAQLEKGVQKAAVEAGLTRAAARLGTSGPQAIAGAEASSGTGQAQNQTPQANDVQRSAQAQTARQSAPAKPIVQQITVNISKAIAEGLDRINIQLRPEELGRVEVRLEVNQNGRVNAQVIVDRPETLELLRNDSRNLEKALQDAGFETGAGDLSFDLRQQDPNQDADGDSHTAGNGGDDTGDAEAELAQMLINGEPLSIISDDRVDIRA